MKNVVGYARVSTDKEEQALSFIAQQKFFKQYCIEKNYNLINIYADEGISGTSTKNRPELLAMLKQAGVILENDIFKNIRIQSKPFDLILIKNTSRLGRNLNEVRQIVRNLKEHKIYIHFIDNNINTEDSGSDFMLSLLQLFDEQYSKDLGAKVRHGFQVQAATNNKIHSNSKIYGYKYTNNELKIIPNEAEVIKLIYDLYEQGFGFRRIANILDNKGLKTREGKRFGKTTLHNILTNEKYTGVNNRLKYEMNEVLMNGNRTPHLRENAEQYFKDSNKIEVIISKEQFNRVQEILASKRGERVGVYRGTTKYASKIKCGLCGSSYTSNVDKGRRFYNCHSKKTLGLKHCNNTNISESKLDKIFTSEWLRNELQSIKLMRKSYIHRAIKELEASKDSNKEEEVKALKVELSILEEKLNKLLDLYLDGVLNKGLYTSKKVILEEQVAQLENKIKELSRSNNEIDQLIQNKRNLITSLNDMRVKAEYSEKEILSYIDTIRVKYNELYVTLNIEGEEVEIPEPIIFNKKEEDYY